MDKSTIAGFVVILLIAIGVVVLEVNESLTVSDYRRILASDSSIGLFVLKNVSGSYELLGRGTIQEFYRWRFNNDKVKLYFGTDLVDSYYWQIFEGSSLRAYKNNEVTELRELSKGRYGIVYEADYYGDSRYTNPVGHFTREVEVYPSLTKETVTFCGVDNGKYNLQYVHETDVLNDAGILKDKLVNSKGLKIDWSDSEGVTSARKYDNGKIKVRYESKSGCQIIDPEVQGVEPKGYKIKGDSVVWNYAGVGAVEVSPHTLKEGVVFVNVTPEKAGSYSFAFGVPDSLKVESAELFVTKQKAVMVEVNHTTQSITYPNGTVGTIFLKNSTTKLINNSDWVDVKKAFSKVQKGGKTWFYATSTFFANESKILRAYIDSELNFVGEVKFDVLIWNASSSLNDALVQKRYVWIDPWIDTTNYEDEFNNANDLNFTKNTARQVDGVLLPDFNATVWEGFYNDDYRTNSITWANTTAASMVAGSSVQFATSNVFSWSTTDGIAGEYVAYYPNDARNNFTVPNVSTTGVMISAMMMSAGGTARTPTIAIKKNWNGLSGTAANPYTENSGDSLYCLGGIDTVLYILQSDEGSVTVRANPAFSGTTGNAWYNVTLFVNQTHVRCSFISGSAGANNKDTGWVTHSLNDLSSGRAFFGLYGGGGAEYFNMTNITVANESSRTFRSAVYESKIVNNTVVVDTVNLTFDFDFKDAGVSIPICQVFDASHANTQNVTWGTNSNPVSNTLSPSITGIGFNCSFTGTGLEKWFALNNTKINAVVTALNSINIIFPVDGRFTNLTYLNVTNFTGTWRYYQNGTFKKEYDGVNGTVILDLGTETDYQINASECDAATCTRNFTVKLRHDNLTPLIDYANPTPAASASSQTTTITVNVTWTEKNNNTHFITMDGTKYFDVNVSSAFFFRKFENLAGGVHTYSATMNDSAGQNNETAQRAYTVLVVGENWWDGRFGRRVNFTLTEENGTNREYEPVEINVTGLAGSITDCVREIRIVYNGSDTKPNRHFEVPSQILKSNEVDGWCYVLFQANVTAGDTVQYFAYYNYSEPYFPDYSSQSTLTVTYDSSTPTGHMEFHWKGLNSSTTEENRFRIITNDSTYTTGDGHYWDRTFIASNAGAANHMILRADTNPGGAYDYLPFPLMTQIDTTSNYFFSNLTMNGSVAKEAFVRYVPSAVSGNVYKQAKITVYDKWPLVKMDFFNTTDAPALTTVDTANYSWYNGSGLVRTGSESSNVVEVESWFAVGYYDVDNGLELGILAANGSTLGVNRTFTALANSRTIVGDVVAVNGTFFVGFFDNAKNVGDSPTREFYEMMQHLLRPRFGSVELVPEATTIVTLYLDNFSVDKYYEFETTASISVALQTSIANFTINSTGNLTICYDVITGEFGSNYVCGNITDVVEVNLTRLSENYLGNLTANATAMNRSDNGKFNTTIDNRTILRLFTFNITGFASGGNYPENITFNILVNRTEASLPGMLVGKDLFEDEFIIGGSTKTIHNITYAQASSEKIFLNVSMVGVLQLEASVGSKNLTLNLSFNLSGFIVDANVSFRITDNLSTNAYINFTASYNATTNSTPYRSNLSAWDNFASNLTAAGINRWTYETLSGAGLIIQEYRGPSGYGNSIERNNITSLSSSGNDGAARYYETEFDIRNLSRIDIDWFQLTSCGVTSQSCSATTRVIVFDGTVQATLRDYTSSCGPCFFSVSYSADENISIRKVNDLQFDIYVNDALFQTVSLSGLDATKSWRLGFYGEESGTGSIGMDLHKISFNAIMAARSGPWNNQYNKSFSVVSKPVDLVVDNITAASLEAVDLTIGNFGQVNRTFELSNDNGKNWVVVTLGSRRVFDSLGSDLVWRVNCTAADTRDTCIFSKVISMVNPGQVNNITIDYGDDGIADFFFNGVLNTSNSPIKVTNSSIPIWTHAKNNCAGALTCIVPIKITAGSEGIIQIGNVNRTQVVSNITLNHTLFEADTQIFWNATFTNGIIMLDDLKARYAGSRNFSIFAHFDGSGGFLKSNNTRMMNIINSVFNETLPKLISQFEIIPKTVNDKNLTPYGQNSTRPFLNITSNAYDIPLNYSIVLNQTPPSCIAIRMANNSNFANSIPLNTTRIWNKFAAAPKGTVGAWFQVDLNSCNASSLFNFNFDYKSMSLCDRCVHTIDRDS